jgi:hypothetical protein
MTDLTLQATKIDLAINDTVIDLSLVPNVITLDFGAIGPQGVKGDPGVAGVFGEAPTGLINGVNATFQSQYDFIPESVSVFLNGMRLKVIADYQTSGARMVNLNVSPTVGEMIQIDYLRG